MQRQSRAGKEMPDKSVFDIPVKTSLSRDIKTNNAKQNSSQTSGSINQPASSEKSTDSKSVSKDQTRKPKNAKVEQMDVDWDSEGDFDIEEVDAVMESKTVSQASRTRKSPRKSPSPGPSRPKGKRSPSPGPKGRRGQKSPSPVPQGQKSTRSRSRSPKPDPVKEAVTVKKELVSPPGSQRNANSLNQSQRSRSQVSTVQPKTEPEDVLRADNGVSKRIK